MCNFRAETVTPGSLGAVAVKDCRGLSAVVDRRAAIMRIIQRQNRIVLN